MIRIKVVVFLASEIKDAFVLSRILRGDSSPVLNYVAVENGESDAISEKCEFEGTRGSGDRIDGFSRMIGMFQSTVNGSTYLIIGPGCTSRPDVPLGDIQKELAVTLSHTPTASTVQRAVSDPTDDELKKMRIVSSMADIGGGQKLADLLNVSEYVAIRNGDCSQLVGKCECQVYNGFGYGLTQWGYEKKLGMQLDRISEDERYLIVGPGNEFELDTPQTELALRLREMLERDIPTPNEDKKLEITGDKQLTGESCNQDTPRWFERLREESQGHIMNEDGGIMKLGNGSGKETYYCGEFKGPTSFICISAKFTHPHDDSCGPDNGMQCTACKVVQDSKMVSKTAQENCHLKFKPMLQMLTLDINSSGSRVKGANDTTDNRESMNVLDVVNVCNGKLNVNQASKTIFCTILEMVEETCIGASLNHTVSGLGITIDSATCIVEISDPKTHNSMVINMKCNMKRTIDKSIEQYNKVYTSCTFNVKYNDMVERMWNPKLGIVSSMADIGGGQKLADLLTRSEYVAIRNGKREDLIDKCQIEVVRDVHVHGYGLKKFGYQKGFGMNRERISESAEYLFVGPTKGLGFTTPVTELVVQLKALLYTEMQTN